MDTYLHVRPFIIIVIIVMFMSTTTFTSTFTFTFTAMFKTNLQVNMCKSVIRAKLSFFHANPTGRILNRFSLD